MFAQLSAKTTSCVGAGVDDSTEPPTNDAIIDQNTLTPLEVFRPHDHTPIELLVVKGGCSRYPERALVRGSRNVSSPIDRPMSGLWTVRLKKDTISEQLECERAQPLFETELYS